MMSVLPRATRTHLRQPEVKVLDASVEVLLLVGLFQFLTLLCRFVDQELPLLIQGVESRLMRTESYELFPANEFQSTIRLYSQMQHSQTG